MGNISKIKRERMFKFLEKIRDEHDDSEIMIAINEIESELMDKKYGLVWEEHEEQVDIEMITKVPVFSNVSNKEIKINESKPFNFILEGDNLHSLKLLEKTHKNKIDVIYIDPPYNTGAKDWKYDNDYVDKEDGFRHSKWLSMMSNRLKIAKNLLKPDGALVCAIDENELATTLLLLDDIFGPMYKVDCITVVHNPRGIQGNNFSFIHEYAIFVYNKSYKVIGNKELEPEDIDWSNFRNWGSESERTDAKNCFYPVIIKGNEIVGFGNVLEDNKHPQQTEFNEEEGTYYVYPIDIGGVERKWRYARQSVDDIKHLLRVKESRGRYEIEIGKDFASYKTVWTDKKYDANEYGTQLINSMVKGNDFDFPKSIYNVYDCLYAIVKDRPNATILDFFAGSGTTGHATILLNKNLGGDRKFILCTNNAVGLKKEKEFVKKYGAIEENIDKWEEYRNTYGIASSITYPRIKAAIHGYKHSKDMKTILFEKNLTISDLKKSESIMEKIAEIESKNKDKYDNCKTVIEDGRIKLLGIIKKGNNVEGIPTNLKYFKTEFINKELDEDEEYDITTKLTKHITEMVELENSISINDIEYRILFNDDDADELISDLEVLKKCKKLYISSNVLLTKQQEVLIDKFCIEVIPIPEYYFSNELREVGEI